MRGLYAFIGVPAVCGFVAVLWEHVPALFAAVVL